MTYDVSELYGHRPFISRDGADNQGVRAEVKVITGYGAIDGDAANEAGINDYKGLSELDRGDYKVEFFKGNKYKESAYVTSKDLIDKLKEAEKTNTPIHFRIEYQRKKGVPRNLPFEEIIPPNDMAAARKNGSRRLVGLRFDDEDEWTYDKNSALTNPAEDSSNFMSFSAFNNPVEATSGSQSAPATRHSFSSPYATIVRGEINPGSVATGVASTMFFFLLQQANKHEVEVDNKHLRKITERLIGVCNRICVTNAKDDDYTIDLGDSLHTRSRSVVFSAVEHLTPFDAKAYGDPGNWLKEVYKSANAVFKWSYGVAESNCLPESDDE